MTLTPLVHKTMSFTPPPGTPSAVDAPPQGATSLAPGAYGAVDARSKSTLTLSAGTYLFDSFHLEPDATLALDTSGGAVRLFVKRHLDWGGVVSGDATKFALAYLASDELVLPPAFTGTALAPNATLHLLGGSYLGVFYGRNLQVDAGARIRALASPLLVGGIAVSTTTPCAGDEVEVTLSVPGDPTATPWIQDLVGSHQFVQFGAYGTRQIVGSVLTTDGRADWVTVPIDVQQCAAAPGAPPPLALHFHAAYGQQNTVEFVVNAFNASGAEITMTTPATYAWSFGDGQTLTTTSPLVWHDYTAAMAPFSQFSFFDAQVSVTTSAGTVLEQKVVPIFSIYADNRAKGIVQPPTQVTSVSATSVGLTLTNYEPTPVSIAQANLELLPCDPALPARPQPPQAMALTIPAASSSTVNVTPPLLPPDVCALGIHLIGTAPVGTVNADAYVRAGDNPLLRQRVTDPATLALLNQASTLTASPDRFDEFELRQLVAQGLLPSLPPPVPPGTTYTNPGDSCQPGDTSPGFVCQPTNQWMIVPSSVLNASVGNFIMDHGCGQIGQLLSSVHQLYSHSSLVTKNYVEVRHSTAAAGRIDGISAINLPLTSSAPPLYAMDPGKLQFSFPGTQGAATHSIHEMTRYYCVPDPNGQADPQPDCPAGSWELSGELSMDPVQCTGVDSNAVSALVLKPKPGAPASIVATMQGVGSQALNINGNYSWFMYSHADEEAVASDLSGDASWANGTEESVCSSFERLAASGAAGPNSLWPSTSAVQRVLDGMRQYQVPERTAAAYALNGQVYNQVYNQCITEGWYIDALQFILPGGPEEACNFLANNVANQLCNCFGFNHCADDSTAWQNPGTGVAVSPDDMRSWDAWDTQPPGTYGYEEPMVYVPYMAVRVYEFQPLAGDGSLTVTVVDNTGAAMPGVNVLVDGVVAGVTDPNGQFPPVGASPLTLNAGAHDVEAQFYAGPQLPTVPPPSVSAADISNLPACSPPPPPGSTACQTQGQFPTCPVQWALGPCAYQNCADYEGCTVVTTACACYPPAQPPPSCCFLDTVRQINIPANSQESLQNLAMRRHVCERHAVRYVPRRRRPELLPSGVLFLPAMRRRIHMYERHLCCKHDTGAERAERLRGGDGLPQWRWLPTGGPLRSLVREHPGGLRCDEGRPQRRGRHHRCRRHVYCH